MTRWIAMVGVLGTACGPNAPPPAMEPSTAPAPSPERPPAPSAPALASPRVPVPMSASASRSAGERCVGRWDLTRHIVLRPNVVERPIRARAPTERPAERWTFHADGRFEHALGTLTSAGRWRVAGSLDGPPAWDGLAPSGWWVVALEDVVLSALPDMAPRTEWALLAADRDSRVVVGLGARLDPEAADLGGRFVAAP